MTEEWRPIPGYEGLYEASSHGRIRSLDRRVRTARGDRITRGVVKKPAVKDTGRLQVHLAREGRKAPWTVHRLVALTFLGPQPGPGYMVLHWDDDPSNNHVSNLRWGTQSENEHDRVRNGGNVQANKTHCVHGHEYTEANTWRDANGWRHCRTCRADQQRKRASLRVPVDQEHELGGDEDDASEQG